MGVYSTHLLVFLDFALYDDTVPFMVTKKPEGGLFLVGTEASEFIPTEAEGPM